MKNFYYQLSLALTFLFINLPLNSFAARSARRAADNCKTEACDSISAGGGYPWWAWVLGIAVAFALAHQWPTKRPDKD